ncbi:MAG: MlaD family protein, partial [Bacteroidota bacterium]
MSKEVRIGIIAVISGLILYYGFNFLKGSDVLSRNKYYFAVYNNVGSLATSNLVKINGVPVGRVTRIDLLQTQSDKVLVEFDVREDIILGVGTVAELTSDLLGGTSIVLRVEDISKPMDSGDTLISRVDKGLEEILESARPAANNLNLVINKLDALLEEFEGIGIQLKQTISGLDTTRYYLNNTLLSTNSLVTNTSGLIGNINSRVAQLDPILGKADAMMDSIDAAALGQTLAEVKKLTEELNTL